MCGMPGLILEEAVTSEPRTLQNAFKGEFLFFLYVIAYIFCHHFMRGDYDLAICEVKMIKLDTKDPTLTVAPPVIKPPEPTARFIVPVTHPEADLAVMAPRLLQLADHAGAGILLLGLCDAPEQELSMRRAVATFRALLNNGSVSATSEVMVGGDWLHLVKAHWRPGDIVVCLDEQPAAVSKKSLSQALARDVDMPILFVSMAQRQEHLQRAWLPQAAAWAGSMAIILGFLILQIQAGDFAGKFTSILQLTTLCIEVALIIGWNALLG
jgi:hypothetical protein